MVQSFTHSNPKIKKLIKISDLTFDLSAAAEVLHWDQETYMPPKGIIHRSRQLATLSTLLHEKLTSPKVGKLLDELENEVKREHSDFNDSDLALVREMRRSYDKATKLPEKLVRDLTEAASSGLEAWKEARTKKDFSIFEPALTRNVALLSQKAELNGYQDSRYNALLDDFEPGVTASEITKIFEPLKKELIDLIKQISAKKHSPRNFLRGQKFDQSTMIKVTEKFLEKVGYDFQAGRQDISTHPFTINFGHQDVRVTNRFNTTDLASSIFSAIHEGGHGLYELGISDTIGSSVLAGGASLGIHESQSRTWENIIGRSLNFWRYWTPYLQVEFPNQLGKATPEELYQEVNEVQPGFIRVDADEVTYNLHIILRFEIERDLIEEKIKVPDLPEIWNEKRVKYLGIKPPDDSLGVLQDIHWSQGYIGYFPTYSLGNINAAQFWNKLTEDVKEVDPHIESGNFEPILHWLRQNIHEFGKIYEPNDLLKKVTGQSLNPQYFTNYINKKYSKLYHLT